ncbi:MAG: zf-HC2 domain-containing protein, partial [Planctomycetales bacterium]|nr:zf-HC2 domain-containing protein [Planctomycetales bacterium]
MITFVNDYENHTTMTPTLECYSREQLRDYALGRLSDELSATVELHLRDCSTCDETIASIDDSVDSLVSQIRGGPRQSRYEDSA